MNRNSILFKMCTLNRLHLRSQEEIPVCKLVGGFLETVCQAFAATVVGSVLLFIIGSTIGESIAMIVTKTFNESIAWAVICAVSGSICLIAALILMAFTVHCVRDWLKAVTERCKKIKITG